MKKIMLLTPKYTLYKNDVRRCVTPLGLGYIASVLEENGYEVRILDVANEGHNNIEKEGKFITFGLSDKQITKRISNFKPDAIGVSCIFSSQKDNVLKILKLIKNHDKSIITFTGGSHPTYDTKELLDVKSLDYIILGEGEITTLKLFEALNGKGNIHKIGGLAYKRNGKKYINRKLEFIKDINTIPFPARHLFNMEMYFKINLPHNPYSNGKRVTQIMTSRGCPLKCFFCTSTNFWGNRYRYRSVENVLTEVKALKKEYQIDEIQFVDDNVSVIRNRLIKIIEGIHNFGIKINHPQGFSVWTLDFELLKKLKECGFHQITFPIESGNQYVINNIIKKPLDLSKIKPLVNEVHNLGMKAHAFCICGFPNETIEMMKDSYRFIKDCRFDTASFFVANPLVGSELHRICKKKGYLDNEQNIFFKVGNISTEHFTSKEVQELVSFFNKRFSEKDNREKKFENGKY